jgi:hypothetical protein
MRILSIIAPLYYPSCRRGINETLLFEDAGRIIILARHDFATTWILGKRPYYSDDNTWKVLKTFRRIVARISNFRARTLAFALNYYRGWVNLRKETKINYVEVLSESSGPVRFLLEDSSQLSSMDIGYYWRMRVLFMCMTSGHIYDRYFPH